MTDDQLSRNQSIAPSWWITCAEVLWIVCLFFLFAGYEPPSEGESHYLAKAKHYWNPDWCAGDLFLESADAHYAFYWAFGWVTAIVSLEASSWILRVITWTLLAIAWQRLSWAMIPQRLWSILTAALLLVALQLAPMAGEWIVGGVEGKGFAYAALFVAIERAMRGHWNTAWVFIGIASAFHVLVGGWCGLMLGFAWLTLPAERPPLRSMAWGLSFGVAIAMWGLVPAVWLTRGTPADITNMANQIYVFDRLPHHLVVHSFPRDPMVQFFVCLAIGAVLAWQKRAVRELRFLWMLVLASMLIALAGVIIDQSLLNQRELAAKLLKYYWYRMSDAFVSIGLAMSVAIAVYTIDASRARLAQSLLAILVVVCSILMIDHVQKRRAMPLPMSVMQARPTPDSRVPNLRKRWAMNRNESLAVDDFETVTAEEHFHDWVKMCRWIEQNTAENSRFLVPRSQQTFKWYAGRSDVVNWKDIPQDAASIVKWREVLLEIYPRPSYRSDLLFHSDAKLSELGKKYNAQYVVIDRSRGKRFVGMQRVYPRSPAVPSVLEVYRLPETKEPVR